MTDDFPGRRAAMVERLRRGGCTDRRVLRAMGTVPRERFLPLRRAAEAYADHPVHIGSGQTVSAPGIVALTAEALQLRGRERVLEVGGGSGYAAAVLGMLAGRVVSLERRARLAERAGATLAALRFDNVEMRHADGADGAADAAPFDAIAVAAMAEDIPRALLDQLAPHGVLVCPVGRSGDGTLVRYADGRRSSLAAVRFVPLVGGTDR